MLAYVNLIQRKEKEIGCDVLTHQKWSVSSFSQSIRLLTQALGAAPTTLTASCKRCPRARQARRRLGRIRRSTRSKFAA